MSKFSRHVLIPAIAPVIFFGIAATPVAAIGCARRGLLALAVSLISGVWGVGASILGVRSRLRRDPAAYWWIISTLILIVPVVGMLLLA